MSSKFKFLSILVVGLYGITMGDGARCTVNNCVQALKDCRERTGKANDGKDWWACEGYKDTTVQGLIGKAYFACCNGYRPKLPGNLVVNSCEKANCDLARELCAGDQFK